MTRWTTAQLAAHRARQTGEPMPPRALRRSAARGCLPPVEADIHAGVVRALGMLARPGVVWWHTPNGERRDKRDAAKLARLGVRAGIPDLFVLISGRLHGIELKRPGGRTSAAQRQMHDALTAAGGLVVTVSAVDDALAVLRAWGAIR